MSDTDQQDYTDIIETLEKLEQSLMEYEDALNDNCDDGSLIHILFRYAHNLKSSLGMAHKQYCSELTHAIENNFDLIRNGTMSPTHELIDMALDAVDLIKANLFQETEQKEELESCKANFDEYKENPQKTEEAIITFILSDEQKNEVAKQAALGKNIYQIEKLIKTDIDKEQYESLPIYDDVRELGTLLAVYPPYEEINTKGEEGIVKILFATEMSEEDLYFEIFDPMKKIELHKGGEQEDQKPACAAPPSEKEEAETEAAVPVKPAAETNTEKKDLHILVVEDDFTTRHLEVKIMQNFGSCEVAVDGSEAISAFEMESLDGNRYDIILLDILLPGFDGHEVLKRIRDFEAEKGIHGFERTKIIIVSNLRDMENISKSFREQSDSYIVKPVTRKKVERELRRLSLI